MLLSTLKPRAVANLRLTVGIFQPTQKVDVHLSDRSTKTTIEHKGEYRVEFPYRVYVNNNAILLSDMYKVDDMVTGRWGWNFKPHPDMDVYSESWYEKQDAYLSFEKQEDAVQVQLSMQFNKD